MVCAAMSFMHITFLNNSDFIIVCFGFFFFIFESRIWKNATNIHNELWKPHLEWQNSLVCIVHVQGRACHCRQQYHLYQGYPVLVLEGLYPTSFTCFPAPTHQIYWSEYPFMFYRSLLITCWFKSGALEQRTIWNREDNDPLDQRWTPLTKTLSTWKMSFQCNLF